MHDVWTRPIHMPLESITSHRAPSWAHQWIVNASIVLQLQVLPVCTQLSRQLSSLQMHPLSMSHKRGQRTYRRGKCKILFTPTSATFLASNWSFDWISLHRRDCEQTYRRIAVTSNRHLRWSRPECQREEGRCILSLLKTIDHHHSIDYIHIDLVH